jgi:hypothetical protein
VRGAVRRRKIVKGDLTDTSEEYSVGETHVRQTVK